jgi:hypothetical protein
LNYAPTEWRTPKAGAPDKWILPDGLDPDRVEKAVEVVVNWEEDGAESAIDLILRLYPIFFSRTSQADSSLSHEEKTSGGESDQ